MGVFGPFAQWVERGADTRTQGHGFQPHTDQIKQ